jgi:peroxiredoxin Q/BCP
LRERYEEFRRRGAEIICLAPHDLVATQQLVAELDLPFPVLADEYRSVFRTYDVQARLWSLGQRPGLYVVDRQGEVHLVHVGWQQWDLPSVDRVLQVVEELRI